MKQRRRLLALLLASTIAMGSFTGALALTDEELQQYTAEQLVELVEGKAKEVYAARENEFGEQLMRELERVLMLRVVDEYWMDQIDAMAHPSFPYQ